jgi:hemerythrin
VGPKGWPAEPIAKGKLMGGSMPIVEWKESFRIGVHEFDLHHQHLLDLLNKTYDEYMSRSAEHDIGVVLDELADYACFHFACEESWMENTYYPDIEKHKAEHHSFTRRVADIQHDFHNYGMNISLEIITFLNDWLINHILKTDAKYSLFTAIEANRWDTVSDSSYISG